MAFYQWEVDQLVIEPECDNEQDDPKMIRNCYVCAKEMFKSAEETRMDKNGCLCSDCDSDPDDKDPPMQIILKTLTVGTVTLDVHSNDTIIDVMAKLRRKLDDTFQGVDAELLISRECANHLVFAGKTLEEGRTLSDFNVQKGSLLHMVSGLGGQGPPVIKKHLKKDQALAELKSRAAKLIKKTEVYQDSVVMPGEFKAFVDVVKREANKVSDMKYKDGVENVIQRGLKTVSKDGLNTLLEIMEVDRSAGGRKGSSEERLVKMVPVMFPQIAILERGKVDVALEIENMMTEFVNLYVEEYSTYSSGSAKLNNELIIKHIEKEISIREGYEASGSEPASNSSGSCVVS
eukprot:TRINITY_DN3466_c0_g1_i3.p1 TRINITY_DN3466_c0_g1~~TRINITY_DN3466_c0_g1_i3.p1  ORF type:complete len:347 (+),score=79.76 TRINITY_DN3466_c0_g1_i3:65-1105(+)